MSLYARCTQRLASTCAHGSVWRRRCVRHYASDTVNDNAWFQKVRTELLGRRPFYHHEDLGLLHLEQLNNTLSDIGLRYRKPDPDRRPNVLLAELLTRFNVRQHSANLLSDGTDTMHHPGEPWTRRMWAGGTVKLSPDLKFGCELPFRLEQRAACLERIKDVRLQGTGDEAKIFVTIERRFASSAAGPDQVGARPKVSFKQVICDDDWSDSTVKEERNLVFMKAKTTAELESTQNGQAPKDTRHLKTPGTPEYSFSLTPTRTLLFRYSAATYNAHLLHLDPTYARSVEGHRNVLVHGPLTLTLMLQVLTDHLASPQTGKGRKAITSIEYRNIAPLYCDEEMRICVRNKKRTETGDSWDIWIEGPTGSMAVKAVAHTAVRPAGAIHRTRSKGTTDADLPDVQTVARQAQDRLGALDQEDAGKGRLAGTSRAERRKLWRQKQRREQGQTAAESPIPVHGSDKYSRKWRKQLTDNVLRYHYSDHASPSLNQAEAARSGLAPSQDNPKRPQRPRVDFSTRWRRRSVGKALRYLYSSEHGSPLVTRAVVPRDTEATSLSPASHGETARPLSIRSIKTAGPRVPRVRIQKVELRIQKVEPTVRKVESVRVRKIEGVRIRGMDVHLKETARRRAHAKRTGKSVSRAAHKEQSASE